MNLIQYKIRVLQVVSELREKGIFKPINEMVKSGIIEKNKSRNHNLISTRVRDDAFLELLEKFNDSQE